MALAAAAGAAGTFLFLLLYTLHYIFRYTYLDDDDVAAVPCTGTHLPPPPHMPLSILM